MPQMRTDKGRGQKVWSSTKRTDEELGGPTNSEDQRRALTMDIGGRRECTDGRHEGGCWQSVSLTSSVGTDDESCAGGWGAMIDIGGAMSIIVDGCIIIELFS